MKRVLRLRKLNAAVFCLGLAELLLVAAFGFVRPISDLLLPKPRYAAALAEETAHAYWEATGIPTTFASYNQLPASELQDRLKEATIRAGQFAQFSQLVLSHGQTLSRENLVFGKKGLCSEFIFSETDAALLVVHFSTPLPADKNVLQVNPHPVQKTYGRTCSGLLAFVDAGLLHLKSYPINRLDWHTPGLVNLEPLSEEFPRIISVNPEQSTGSLSFTDADFQTRVRDRISGHQALKLLLLRFGFFPLGLASSILAARAMRRSYSAYLNRDLLASVAAYERDFGNRLTLPSFWQFCLAKDPAFLHEATLSRVRETHQAALDNRQLANSLANADRDLKSALSRFAGNAKATTIINRALASNSLEGKRAVLKSISALGRHRWGRKAFRIGNGGSSKRAVVAPGMTPAQTPQQANYKNLNLGQLFRSSLSHKELAPLLPQGISVPVVQAIVFVLVGAGGGGRRFQSHYRPEKRIYRMAAGKYESWFDHPVDDQAYARAIDWLTKRGVVMAKPKTNGLMLSLASKTSLGSDEVGRQLIGMVNRCIDLLIEQQ